MNCLLGANYLLGVLVSRGAAHRAATPRAEWYILAVPEIGNIILAESEVSHYLLPTSKSKHVQTVLDTDLFSQTHSLLADYFRSAPQTAEQYRTEKPCTHIVIALAWQN